jgi:hypothetical protein
MRKLIAVSVAALALSVTAPAYAIHDPSLPGEECAADNSQAIGHPAGPVLVNTPAGSPNPGGSDFGVSHNPTPDETCPRDL